MTWERLEGRKAKGKIMYLYFNFFKNRKVLKREKIEFWGLDAAELPEPA